MSADTPSTDPVQEETIVVSDTPVGHSGTNVDVMEKPAWTMGPGAAIAANEQAARTAASKVRV